MAILKVFSFLVVFCLLVSNKAFSAEVSGFSIPKEIVTEAKKLQVDNGEGKFGLLTCPYQLENPYLEGMVVATNLNLTVSYTLEKYQALLNQINALETVSEKEKFELELLFSKYKNTIENLASSFESMANVTGPLDTMRADIYKDIEQGKGEFISRLKRLPKGMVLSVPTILGSLATLPQATYWSFFAPVLKQKTDLDAEIELLVGDSEY